MKITTKSAKETVKLAEDFAKSLKGGEVIFLIGDLGTGKTQFTKGIATALEINENEVLSPTFIVLREHTEGRLRLVHTDFYRIDDYEELGFDLNEFITNDSILVLEWADKFADSLPKADYIINFKETKENEREIIIKENS